MELGSRTQEILVRTQLRTLAAISAPCSVKTQGRKRTLRLDAVTFCDRMVSHSAALI